MNDYESYSSLGNCYRLMINGRLIGYFAAETGAEQHEQWWKQTYPQHWKETAIDKWFIEGEF